MLFDFLFSADIFTLYTWEIIIFGLLLLVILWSLIVSIKVNLRFKKFSKVMSQKGFTAEEAAQKVLQNAGVVGVPIRSCSGSLTDHYDPRDNTIYLSDSVRTSTSIAAIGVAAHEAGHAIQHDADYVPFKIRSAIVPAVNIGSRLSIPLIIIGLLIHYIALAAGNLGYIIAIIGVIFYGLTTLFTFITLPVEFNASRRAKKALVSADILTVDETRKVGKVLGAAAQTYVAAFAISVLQFLRLLLLVKGSRR